MIFLYAYLVLGFCMSTAYMLWRMRGESTTVDRREIGETCLAILVGTVIWPGLLYLKVREKLGGSSGRHDMAETRFTVPPKDLGRILNVDEVERAERITDPLNAVPSVPFGHLYPAWLRFKTGMPPGATLWSFESSWTSNWGRRDRRRGYVVVDAYGQIGEHFLAELERLERAD